MGCGETGQIAAAFRDEPPSIAAAAQKIGDLIPVEMEDVHRIRDQACIGKPPAHPDDEPAQRCLGHAVDPVVVGLGQMADPSGILQQGFELCQPGRVVGEARPHPLGQQVRLVGQPRPTFL